MKKIIINQSILVNILKITFLMIVFVSGVGEVSAAAQDEACRGKQPFEKCIYGSADPNTTNYACIPKQSGDNGIPGNLFCENSESNITKAKECKWKLTEGVVCMKGTTLGECIEVISVGRTKTYTCKTTDPESDCTTLACDKKSPPQTCKVTNGTAACDAKDSCNDACKSDPDKPKCQITGTGGAGTCVAEDDYKCKDNPCTGATPHCIVKNGTGTCSSANIPAPDLVDPNDPNTPTPTIEYVEFKNPIRFNNIIELLAGITNALLTLLGVIAVLVVMSAGFKYMTSSNPGEVSQAVGGIRNAVIEIVVIMGA